MICISFYNIDWYIIYSIKLYFYYIYISYIRLQLRLLACDRKQYCSLIFIYFVIYIHFLCYNIYGLNYENILINYIITNFYYSGKLPIRNKKTFELILVQENSHAGRRPFGIYHSGKITGNHNKFITFLSYFDHDRKHTNSIRIVVDQGP